MKIDSSVNTTDGPLIETAKPAKKENLKQRAYLNSITGIIDYAGLTITAFIVNPFIVSGLGSSMYGIWQMLGQMTGYTKLADTRATQVLKWTVAKKRDIASEEELRSDVASAFAITVFVIPIVLLVGGVIVWYAPYITKADAVHYNLIRITCSILMLSIVVTKLFDLYESVLRGMNLAFKRMGLRVIILGMGGALKIFVVTQGYGLIGLAIVQVFVTLVIGITYYVVVKRTVGWFGLGKTSFSKVLAFSKVSSWYFATSISDLILDNSDKILLGFIASPVIVTYYALTLFLPTAMQGIIIRIVMGIMPGIGKLLGLKDYEKLEKTVRNLYGVTFLLTTAAGITIIFFNGSFLNTWMGKGFFAGNLVNTLIVVMIIQDTFVKNDSFIITATLDIKKKLFLTLISGLVFVGLGFLLIDKFGIAGVCISLFISKLIVFIGQRSILRSKIQSRSIIPFFRKVQPFFVSLAMLVSAGYLSTFMQPVGLLPMLAMVPVTFALSFLIYYFLGLRQQDRYELSQIVSSVKFFKADKS